MREIIPAPISTKQQLRHKYGAHFFVPGLTKSVNREMKDAEIDIEFHEVSYKQLVKFKTQIPNKSQ